MNAAKYIARSRLRELRALIDAAEEDMRADDLIDPDPIVEAADQMARAVLGWNTVVLRRAAGVA